MIETIIFVVASIPIIYISRACLRDPRSHGFYRFFAWEIILGLFLLDVRGWFRDPFSLHQIVSWVLLCISPYFVIAGVLLLRRIGKPDPQREGEPLVAFEKTTQLVTEGVYRRIRHPLYASLFLLTWGIFFKSPCWLDAILAVLATVFLFVTARIEENENRSYFGPVYDEYIRKTKMFVPYLF